MLNRRNHTGPHAAILLFAVSIFLILLVRYSQRGRFQSASFPAPVIAEIQGEVARPGVYALQKPAATVADALDAAGGVKKGALSDIPEHLLRREVRSGQLVRVAFQNAECQIRFENMSAAARLALGKKLDLNDSTEEELCLIPKMKPEFARAVTERRREKPWQSLEELRELPGVGPKTIEKWHSFLKVRGRN